MATLPVYFAIFGIGGGELLIVLFIVLLLFGATKLPSLARGLGQSIKEFKKASKDDPEEDKSKKPADPTKTNGSN